MTDLATLQIKVDSTQTTKGATELNKLEQQAVKTENATRKLAASYVSSNNALQRAEQQAKQLELQQKRLEEQQKKTAQSSNSLNKSFSDGINALRGLAASYALLQVIRLADQYVLLQGRVALSTKSVQESKYAFDQLMQSAKNTGSSLQAAVVVFQRISFVRNEIGATVDEMLQFTNTVQKLGVVSGASGDALKFGLTQLGQSLSSDIVRAEEFNSIMENIPAVGKEIADQFGITTGKLRNLVIDGEVLSKDVFAAILNATEEANTKFEKFPMTVGRAFDQFIIGSQNAIGGINEATGATDFLIFAIQKSGQIVAFLSDQIKGFANGISAFFDVVMGVILSDLIRFAGIVETVVNSIISAYNKVSNSTVGTINITGGLKPQDIQDSARDSARKNAAEAGKNFKDSIDSGAEIFGVGSKSPVQSSETSTREISKNYKDIASSSKEATKEIEKQARREKDTIADIKFKTEQLGRTNVEQAVYNELKRAGVDIDSVAGRQIEELTREYERQKTVTEQLKSITDDLSDSLSNAFVDGITGAKTWGEVATSVIKSVQSVLNDYLSNALKGMLNSGSSGGGSGILGSIIGGLGSFLGGGGAQASFATASIRGAANPALFGPGFAEGGSFEVGGKGGTDSQLVSFMASPNERVTVTRPDQRSAEGGGGNVYNIDARGADVAAIQRLEQAITNIDKSVERRSINAVNNTFKRDPSFGGRR